MLLDCRVSIQQTSSQVSSAIPSGVAIVIVFHKPPGQPKRPTAKKKIPDFEYLLEEMSSLSNIEEHLPEQILKKRPIDNLEENPENAKPIEVNVPKTMEVDKNKESVTSTTMDLHPPSRPHRKLPAELNCQIFYCLNLATRRKFICGLGWDFYAMFRQIQILLKKSKRLCNPRGNNWSISNQNVTISEDGLVASYYNTNGWGNIYAEKGFPISGPLCRMDEFPGTICYYYEVKTQSERCVVGLLYGRVNFGIRLGGPANTYSTYTMKNITANESSGQYKLMELPDGVRHQPPNVQGNVYGAGILMDSKNKLTTFFTLNGFLLGKQIPITPSMDRLFPAVSVVEIVPTTFEANFGDDKDKPFLYDISKCPGLELDCI